MSFGVGTTIDGGTDECVLYDNGGVVGEDTSFKWDDTNKSLKQATTITVDDGPASVFHRFSTDDADAKDFIFSTGAASNEVGTRNDLVFDWGYNIGFQGPIDSGDCSWGIQLETYWHPTTEIANVEYILTYTTADKSVSRRPFQYRVNRLNNEVDTVYASDRTYFAHGDPTLLDSYALYKSDQLILGPNCALQWTGVIDFTGTPDHDLSLVRGDVGILDQQDGNTPQAFRIYNQYSGAGANFERLSIGWSSNLVILDQQSGGTGVGRNMRLAVGGNTIDFFNNFAGVQFSNATWAPTADNLVDLGESSAPLRWKNCYLSGVLQIDSDSGIVLTNQVNGAGSSTGTLGNAPHSGNPDAWIVVFRNGTKGWVPWYHA